MSGYAAAGDTWGISGPAFLLLFLGAAVLIVLGAVAHRRRLFAGPPMPPLSQLGPQEVAYLNGGERLAVYSALGGLRSAGVVGVGPDRALAQSAPMPAGVTPLDQAVYNAAGKRLRSRTLAHDPWVRGALDQLREGLERAGLIATADARRAARSGSYLLLILFGVGILRVMAGLDNDRPVGLLLLAEVAVVVAALVLYLRVPRHTGAARRALAELRRRHVHLSPAHHPAFGAYGATGAAMGVALFGVGSLWAMDPAFAAGAELERHSALGGGSSGFGSSGDGSASSAGGGDGGGGAGGGGCGGGCGG